MSTNVVPRSKDGLRWWQYIGPWPLRPWVGFWGAGAVSLIGGLSAQRDEVTSRPVTYALQIVLPYLLGATVLGLYLMLFARVFPKRTPLHLISYLAVILGGVVMATVVTYVLNREFGVADIPEVHNLPFLSVRIWVWSIFLLAVAGLTVRRLSQQTEIAEHALAVSLEQQSLMLVNEERSRRQIALLLHDRVQAGLMNSCLELRMAIAPGSDVDRARIDSIIARLDDIRGMDVRHAARTLSPDLVNVDLHTALQELAHVYEPGMCTFIEISPSITGATTSIPTDALLACYRIVEQGLLNAVVHGGATQCTISMGHVAVDLLSVSLVDNGRGLPAKANPSGFGSAIIDSWCRVLGGSWELEVLPGGGARLSAQIPLDGGPGNGLNERTMSLL